MAIETEDDKREDIVEVVHLLKGLNPTQVEVIRAIVERFAGGFIGELSRDDFLSKADFDYFGTRLAAHHAYSSKMLNAASLHSPSIEQARVTVTTAFVCRNTLSG